MCECACVCERACACVCVCERVWAVACRMRARKSALTPELLPMRKHRSAQHEDAAVCAPECACMRVCECMCLCVRVCGCLCDMCTLVRVCVCLFVRMRAFA